MAYSQFLQQKARKLRINIGPAYKGNEMLVCRRVLEGLSGWLSKDGHENVLSNVNRLSNDLFAINSEIDVMYRQGQLTIFLQSKIIRSVEDLRTNIQEAYSCAFTASEKAKEDDDLTASQHIFKCHDHIQKALADIVIGR
jgi:hypothetical protein